MEIKFFIYKLKIVMKDYIKLCNLISFLKQIYLIINYLFFHSFK